MTYDCMTPDELALWRAAAVAVQGGTTKPCADCPMAFRIQETFRGCCRRPVRVRMVRRRSGPLPLYTKDELRDRHRTQNREHMRAKRARLRRSGDNTLEGDNATPDDGGVQSPHQRSHDESSDSRTPNNVRRDRDAITPRGEVRSDA